MPDHGLHTIAQRIAAISHRPASPAARPAPAADGFDSVLAQQLQQVDLQALQAPATPAYGGSAAGLQLLGQLAPGAAQPVAHGPGGVAAAYAALGPGVQLTGRPAEILPALPGTTTAVPGGFDAAGSAHAGCGPACAHAASVQAAQVHGAAHVHGPPALDRTGPPDELVAYGNGRIPPHALEPLGVGEHALWAPAARAFRDMMAAAAADGVSIGITSSYRTYEKQVELADRLGLYSQGGLAASPGTSNHGWGLSLDLQLDDRAQEWMREHAADYGYVEDVPREPWHWTFKASSY